MAIYRYSPESIDSLTRRTRRHHLVAFLIFTIAVCAAWHVGLPLRVALICDVGFCLVMAVSCFATRRKAWQRTANLYRSTEIEIDDERAVWRSKLANRVLYRSEIQEVCFSPRGIWLRGKSRRVRLQIPKEIEGFASLESLLEQWLPAYVIRRNSPPSSFLEYVQVYAIWIGAALLLYAALASKTRLIATPACVLAAIGLAWYFAWCGRKFDERKWRILMPISGYFGAVALLARAATLWITR